MTGRGTSYEGKAPAQVTPERGGKRVALVIGNGRYAHAAPLDNPTRDAEAMAAVLVRLGFDVVKGLDLDLRRIGDVQGAFEDNLRDRPDVALLFYAGHGLQVDGRNYLIPVDAEITQKAHLASRALLFNDVLDGMAQQAGASLVFLDACRDNPFTRNLARSLGDSARYAGVRGGLARMEKVAGTFIAYATAPDQVAFDGKGTNSPFTAALLQHIETPGLSVGDLMIDVRNKVLAETSGRQEPWDQSSLRARFYFVPSEPEPPRPVSEAAGEWVAIQSTTSLATLALFMERHAGTPWAEYARARIGELRLQDQQRQEAEAARTEADRVHAAAIASGPQPQSHTSETALPSASASAILEDISPNLPLRWIGGGLAVAALAAVLIWRPWEGAPLATADGKAAVADVAPAAKVAPPPGPAAREAQIKQAPPEVGAPKAQGPQVGPNQPTPAPKQSTFIPHTGFAFTPYPSPPPPAGCAAVEVAGQGTRCLNPKDTFQDCFTSQGKRVCGPQMVVVPAGKFLMGSPEDANDRETAEGPQHEVTIATPFAVGMTHVMRGEFAAFVAATGHKTDGGCAILRESLLELQAYLGSQDSKLDDKASWRAPGFDQDDTHPVVCVNWHDAQAYVAWLTQRTTAKYRLLTEAEAESVARGTTTTNRQPRYFFGDDPKDLCNYGNGADLTTKAKFPSWTVAECKDGYVHTAPAGHFAANAFGVKDVDGNAWTWVQDCWVDNYNNAPLDGAKAVETKDCKYRVMRGGSWATGPRGQRVAFRTWSGPRSRLSEVGFRVARVLAAPATTRPAAPADAPAPAPVPR
jgi:formylglycine-generating enzyme required for sulfatase activity